MARTPNQIVNRIVIEGADAAIRALRELGKVGEAAFTSIQRSAGDAQRPVQNTTRDFENAEQSARRLQSNLGGVANGLKIAAYSFGLAASSAVAASFAFTRFALTATEAIRDAQREADKLGLPQNLFNQLTALSRVVGGTGAEVKAGFEKINEAAEKTEKVFKGAPEVGKWARFYQNGILRVRMVTQENLAEIRKAWLDTFPKLKKELEKVGGDYTQLGVNLLDNKNKARDVEKVYADIVKVLQKTSDEEERGKLATKLLGDEFGYLVNKAIGTKGGIEGLNKTLAALNVGVGMDAGLQQVAERFNTTWQLIKLGVERIKTEFGIEVAAAFQEPLDKLLQFLIDNRTEITATLSRFVDRLRQLAFDVANALVPVRDAAGAFQFVNDAKVSEANRWLITLRDAFIAVAEGVSIFAKAVSFAFGVIKVPFDFIAQALNYVFGTEISGGALLVATAIGLISGAFGVLAAIVRGVFLAFQFLAPFLSGPVAAGFGVVAGVITALYANMGRIGEIAGRFVDTVRSTLSELPSLAVSVLRGFADAFVDCFNDIRKFFSKLLSDLWAGLRSLFSAAQSGPSGPSSGPSTPTFDTGGGPDGFATGGFVTGPGTGRSDSIPAWLSNGEFVIRADAVRRYGVAFFEALNGLRLGPSLSMGRMGFAGGGLVPARAMSAVSGGGGNPMTLVIDGQQFSGLTVTDGTRRDLQRYAAQSGSRSLGRKPSWFGA